MSHVLLVSLVFAPDGVSTAQLMTELAVELKNKGHQITVLTTTPHYNVEPEARAKQPLTKKWGGLLYESDYEGIRVLHASIPVKGSRVGARIFDYLRYHAISTIAGLVAVGKVDVQLVPSPPLTIGLSAWILRLFKRAPFIYTVQEIYPDVAVSLGLLKNQRVIRLLEQLESFIYKRSKVVTVISERFRQRLLAKKVDPAKMVVIPNFVDTSFVSPQAKRNPFSEEQGIADQFVVLYAGNIGLTQGFESIMASAERLRDIPDLVFVIVGDGTRREWLEEQLATKSFPNVKLLPYQKRSMVPYIYGSADLCLVPLKSGTAQETFPSKIYTIMAAGRAVLASADPQSELTDLVQESNCGWTVPPDDVEALTHAICEAYEQKTEVIARGKQGRQHVVAHYSKEAVTQQYDQLINDVVR